MNRFGKIFAAALGAIIVGTTAAATYISMQRDSGFPSVARSQQEAIYECGGAATAETLIEETGDGKIVVVEVWSCPDGTHLLAAR